MANVRPGDVVIRHYVGESFQLIDAVTQEQLAIVPSVDTAVKMACQRVGAVWQEKKAEHTAAGAPVLILIKTRTH